MNEPQAVQACHQLIAWMIPKIDQFPRHRRFTLGDRIETRLLTVLECLVSAAFGVRRKASLEKANQQLDVVRHLWRLAWELKAVATNAWEHGSRLLVGLGQQVGGWRRDQA